MSRTAAGYSLVYAHPSGGRLFQGGAEDAEGAIWAARSASPDALPFRVDLLVLCAYEFQPRSRAVSILSVPLDDRLFRSSAEARAVTSMAKEAGCFAADRVICGEKVLICCAAGLNRSGIVSAYTLKQLGVDGASAVRKIRRARGPNALGNSSFLHAILA